MIEKDELISPVGRTCESITRHSLSGETVRCAVVLVALMSGFVTDIQPLCSSVSPPNSAMSNRRYFVLIGWASLRQFDF